MIYTLILTAVFSGYSNTQTAVHSEHDYPSYEACQTAWHVAQDQMKRPSLNWIAGTCVKVK